VISASQRPLPDNTQHSQQTNIHVPGGTGTHDLSRRAVTDPRLRPRGHWDRRTVRITPCNTTERPFYDLYTLILNSSGVLLQFIFCSVYFLELGKHFKVFNGPPTVRIILKDYLPRNRNRRWYRHRNMEDDMRYEIFQDKPEPLSLILSAVSLNLP